MKKLSQSRTVHFNMFMAALETLHGSIHLIQPMLSSDNFATISLLLGIIHAMGGVYMRSITSTPIRND